MKYKLIKGWLKLKDKINKKIKKKEPKLDQIQKKAIELYNLYLKDKESLIDCSFISKKRHIEKDGVLMILGPGLQESILTVIDENKSNVINCYEVLIPNIKYIEMSDEFDDEMERRLRTAENSKKEAITKDLDKLIQTALKKNEASLESKNKI